MFPLTSKSITELAKLAVGIHDEPFGHFRMLEVGLVEHGHPVLVTLSVFTSSGGQVHAVLD